MRRAAVLQRGRGRAEPAALSTLALPAALRARPRASRLSEGAWLWLVMALPAQGRRGGDLGSLAASREPGASGTLPKGVCPPAAVWLGRGREAGLLPQSRGARHGLVHPGASPGLLEPALASPLHRLASLRYQQMLFPCVLSTKPHRCHFVRGERAPPGQKVPRRTWQQGQGCKGKHFPAVGFCVYLGAMLSLTNPKLERERRYVRGREQRPSTFGSASLEISHLPRLFWKSPEF